jgi:hypothetical protein
MKSLRVFSYTRKSGQPPTGWLPQPLKSILNLNSIGKTLWYSWATIMQIAIFSVPSWWRGFQSKSIIFWLRMLPISSRSKSTFQIYTLPAIIVIWLTTHSVIKKITKSKHGTKPFGSSSTIVGLSSSSRTAPPLQMQRLALGVPNPIILKSTDIVSMSATSLRSVIS